MKPFILLIILFVVLIAYYSTDNLKPQNNQTFPYNPFITKSTATPQPTKKSSANFVPSPTPKIFSDNFSKGGTLEESASRKQSQSKSWWLSSGGEFHWQNGIAQTLQGPSPEDSYWYQAYASSNPEDTDNGQHPQNLFRLVTRPEF